MCQWLPGWPVRAAASPRAAQEAQKAADGRTPQAKEPTLLCTSAQGHARTLYTSINVEQNLATGDPEPGSLEQEITEPRDGLGWEGPPGSARPGAAPAGTRSPEQAARSRLQPGLGRRRDGAPAAALGSAARASAPPGRNFFLILT